MAEASTPAGGTAVPATTARPRLLDAVILLEGLALTLDRVAAQNEDPGGCSGEAREAARRVRDIHAELAAAAGPAESWWPIEARVWEQDLVEAFLYGVPDDDTGEDPVEDRAGQ